MMSSADYIKIILFTILCLCFVFYLFIGIYSYKKDKKSKTNIIFLALCISSSLWAIGYAFILISPNIEIAYLWRIVSALGWCFFNALWLSFALSLRNAGKKNFDLKVQYLAYTASIIFFMINFLFEPSEVVHIHTYGFVDDLYAATTTGAVFSIYFAVLFISGLVIIYFQMKNTKKNRIKRQMKIILITGIIGLCFVVISDVIIPILSIDTFPIGIIAILFGMGGFWYAITKYKMMSISYELVSEYLFEAVNEPICILGEDFIVKNCNEATQNITGANYMDLKGISLDAIINSGNFDFKTIMQTGNVRNIEVGLYWKNNEAHTFELSATVIYDEYKDVLGILVLLHDISERKNLAEIQKKYTLKLEESNLELENEITDRLLAEEKIRYFVYYDALTDLSNRKKMLEYIDLLLVNKNEKFAILFMDLDKFKSVNDNYGHKVGDDILKAVAGRLKSIIRSTDTISRIGGDEFIIILRNLKDTANAEKIAATVVETLGKAFIYKESQLFIGASVGISIFPEHGIDADTLIRRADLAMYEVKSEDGNGYKIYSQEMKEECLWD